MKPTGNRTSATWLWLCACCLLHCCIWNSNRKRISGSCSHLLLLVRWWSAQQRVLETLSHKAKRLRRYLFLLHTPIFPSCLLSTDHTGIMAELVFLETKCLLRILIKCSKDVVSIHAHALSDTQLFIFANGCKQKRAFPKAACRARSSALVRCHCKREQQRDVRGHCCSTITAESQN